MAKPIQYDFLPELLQTAEPIASIAELKLNATGLILDWNAAAGALLNLAAEQVLGCSIFELLAERDPFRRAELLSAFKHATERISDGVRLTWRDEQSVLTLELYAARDRSGDLDHVSLLLRPTEAAAS
jgi:PAS domain-containing protein